MVEDITDKKRVEEARFRHAAIVESSDDAIISKNLDGVIVSWNGGAQRIYGYTEGEAVGKPITILVPRELVDEEDKILERLRAGERLARKLCRTRGVECARSKGCNENMRRRA
jgi:PAS domain S-box-containing protein